MIIEVTPKDIVDGDMNDSAIVLALRRVFKDVDIDTCTADGKKFNFSYTLTARLQENGNYRGGPFLMMFWYYEKSDEWVLSYREPLKAVYNNHTFTYCDHKGHSQCYLSNKEEYR